MMESMKETGVLIDVKIEMTMRAYGEIECLYRSGDEIGARMKAIKLAEDAIECGDTDGMSIESVEVRLDGE